MIGFIIEAIVHGLAHIDVGEEVRRDTVAVQLAAADIGRIRGRIEVHEDIGRG